MNKQEIEKAISKLKSDIEALGNYSKFRPIYEHEPCFEEELIKDLHMAITALEHQVTDTWIPVTERIPTTDGVFEVTIRGSRGKRRVEMCGFHKDAHLDKWGGKYSQLNVIAWRSRPEPWKETI